MPRRSDDYIARRPRVKELPDGSCIYDPRDVGPGAIRKNGQAVMCNITGSHGPQIQATIASQVPSMIIQRTGFGVRPGHRRRRKGGRPGSVNNLRIAFRPDEALEQAHKLHLEVLRTGCMKRWEQLNRLVHQIKQECPGKLADEMGKFVHRETCELGRARNSVGRAVVRFFTVVRPLPLPLPAPSRHVETHAFKEPKWSGVRFEAK